MTRIAPDIITLDDAFHGPRREDEARVATAYTNVVREDERYRRSKYTPRDHVVWLNDLASPLGIEIHSRATLEETLRSVEWYGIAPDESLRIDADPNTFDPARHFVVVRHSSPIGGLDIPGATIVSPLMKVCIVFWNV